MLLTAMIYLLPVFQFLAAIVVIEVVYSILNTRPLECSVFWWNREVWGIWYNGLLGRYM